jgi:dihydrofolate synthase/folylpolyglutamate synthase
LADWLAWQAALHPVEIELGLERCRQVAQRLKLLQPRYTVITVAGTNGKGSHVAMLDTAYRLAGYRVGTYTSPHLVHYNERIRLAGEPVADDVICRAFTQVEAARGETPLTFFEFGTLAALVIFAEAAPDIAILEVGMGGRLDAVNMLDADVAVIATLDIDHVEWLGGTREIIAREKAGILRSGRPAVCSDPAVPASLLAYADEQAVPLALLGVDYHFSEQGERWSWWSGAVSLPDLPRPALSGSYQLRNAAGVLKVIDLLQSRHPVTGEQLADALARVRLQGRFQRFSGPVELILDVAHNAQAVGAFAANLAALPTVSRTHVVLGILRTKDRVGVMRTLDPFVDRWHLATVDAARGASAAELHGTWQSLPRRRPATCYESIAQAWRAACTEATVGERILVIGSFLTVGDVLRDLAAREDPTALSAGTWTRS